MASAGFGRVLRSGRRHADPLFTVYVVPNECGHPRIGITVARKVSTRSVVRNVIKRQVRESFRTHRSQIPAVDLVVVARPPAAAETRPALRASLQRHWEHVSQTCKKSSSS
ncbi:MAG: ribonuclease P protein component [Acidiferrobacterales bacterium]